jgi:hypothetical protein
MKKKTKIEKIPFALGIFGLLYLLCIPLMVGAQVTRTTAALQVANVWTAIQNFTVGFSLNGGVTQTGIQGQSGIVQEAGTNSGTAGALLCNDSSSPPNATTSTCTQPNTNLYFHIRNLASNVPATGNTQQQIDTFTLPALPSGCGTNLCRIRVSYSYYIEGGVEGMCWVTDGSHLWAPSGTNTANNFSYCTNGGELSPATYSSGATPTLSTYVDDLGSVTVCTQTQGTSPCTTGPSSLPTVASAWKFEVVLSN